MNETKITKLSRIFIDLTTKLKIMSLFNELLNGPIGKELVEGTSKQLGLNRASTAAAFGAALPMIMGAMKNNASSSEGAGGLLKALMNSNHSSGGLLNNLSSVLGGAGIDENVLNDGADILSHVFGGQTHNAAQVIGKTSNIDPSVASQIMKMAAPVVMGYLAKNVLHSKVTDGNSLTGMLGSLLDGDDDYVQTASRIQDFDNNDDTIDDLAIKFKQKESSKGFLGDLMNQLLS